MFTLTIDERHNWSREIPLGDANEMTAELIEFWKRLKVSGKIPLKSDMYPWEFKHHLGNICILDVTEDPLDFIYRLSGTFIDAASEENLNGESILKATPENFAKVTYMDFRDSHHRAAPVLWLAELHKVSDIFYTRLVLPLSKSGENVDYLMTYSFCLDSLNGVFPIGFKQDQSNNMFDWPSHT